MTTQTPGLILSLTQQDTSVAAYRIVKLGTADKNIVAATDATAPLLGVADQTVSGVAGESAAVITSGTAKITIAAATARGAKITAAAGGKGAATTTEDDEIIGVLLQTTTGADEIAEVLLNPSAI